MCHVYDIQTDIAKFGIAETSESYCTTPLSRRGLAETEDQSCAVMTVLYNRVLERFSNTVNVDVSVSDFALAPRSSHARAQLACNRTEV